MPLVVGVDTAAWWMNSAQISYRHRQSAAEIDSPDVERHPPEGLPTMFAATLNVDILAHKCEQRGITAAELADRMGISESTFYRVLRGESPPSNTFIAGLAVIFGTNALPQLLRFGDRHTSAPAGKPRGFGTTSRARHRNSGDVA